jgi:hypothetical protein
VELGALVDKKVLVDVNEEEEEQEEMSEREKGESSSPLSDAEEEIGAAVARFRDAGFLGWCEDGCRRGSRQGCFGCCTPAGVDECAESRRDCGGGVRCSFKSSTLSPTSAVGCFDVLASVGFSGRDSGAVDVSS